MISRKERRIQKALGLEDDMPLTICKHVRYLCKGWWWCHITAKTYKWRGDAFWQWLAFKLPKKLVYHGAIRLWAHATCCDEAQKLNECVHDTTVDDAIRRWEHSK